MSIKHAFALHATRKTSTCTAGLAVAFLLGATTISAQGSSNLPAPNLSLGSEYTEQDLGNLTVWALALQWAPVHDAQSYRIRIRDPYTNEVLVNQPAKSPLQPFVAYNDVKYELASSATSGASVRVQMGHAQQVIQTQTTIAQSFPWHAIQFPTSPQGRFLHVGVSSCTDFIAEDCGPTAWLDIQWVSPPTPPSQAPASPPVQQVPAGPTAFQHEFSWQSVPIAPETVEAFSLHPGASGRQLQDAVEGRARLHPSGQTCTSCHGGGAQDHAPDLTRVTASRFCHALATFNSPSKPDSLRRFFADWHTRGCPQ